MRLSRLHPQVTFQQKHGLVHGKPLQLQSYLSKPYLSDDAYSINMIGAYPNFRLGLGVLAIMPSTNPSDNSIREFTYLTPLLNGPPIVEIKTGGTFIITHCFNSRGEKVLIKGWRS